jgi:hypothetical protein
MARYLFYIIFASMFLYSIGMGIWTTVARNRAARRMATRAGLNPQDAASTAMYTPDGLDATYLVAATRPGYPAGGAAPSNPASTKSVADRLRELDNLKASGLISDDEYNAQHKAIVSSV